MRQYILSEGVTDQGPPLYPETHMCSEIHSVTCPWSTLPVGCSSTRLSVGQHTKEDPSWEPRSSSDGWFGSKTPQKPCPHFRRVNGVKSAGPNLLPSLTRAVLALQPTAPTVFPAPSPSSLTQEFLLIRILAASIPSWRLLLRGHVPHLKIPPAYIRQNLSTLPNERGSQLLCGYMNLKKQALTKRTENEQALRTWIKSYRKRKRQSWKKGRKK